MTPYEIVRDVVPVQDASKRELVGVTRRLERRALTAPPTRVAATLQDVRYLTGRTRAVYAQMAAGGAQVRLLARSLPAWIAPGVAGVALDDDDPLVDEWVVVLPGPSPVVFAATDLHVPDCTDDDERCFTWGSSQDPDVVAACAAALGLPD